ncbi:outer membrane protein [Bartonella sp. CB74]|uniref:outer membrane protein n=1 Tax=Bartonella sp. CB74 TaxID=3113620 RepID=UPI002F962085
MNIKCLVATSAIALVSASAVQAADIIMPREVPSAVTFTPTFSWTGFYLGGQLGNFSSKVNIGEGEDKLNKDITPKPSGFMGGIYAGSNVHLEKRLILGVETDAVWADHEDIKQIGSATLNNEDWANNLGTQFAGAGANVPAEDKFAIGDKVVDDFTLREKWSGATRVRLGFAISERFMPFVAGGIAYAQMQFINTVSVTKVKSNDTGGSQNAGKNQDDSKNAESQNVITQASAGTTLGATYSANLLDATNIMVGYTLGAGFDFAMTDNVILRAEYRYSDFGKKKFLDDFESKIAYKTNDFRVGVAYKF